MPDDTHTVPSSAPDVPRPDSVAAVLRVLDRLVRAWNDGDAVAYGAAFTTDATYVTFAGDVLSGRGAIEEVHRRLFDGPLRGSRMTPMTDAASGRHPDGSTAVRFLRPGVAHALTGGAVLLPGQDAVTADPDRASVQTFLLLDEGDEWRVAAFHNTRHAAPEGGAR